MAAGRGAPKVFFVMGTAVFALFSMVKSEDTCDIEIENTLKTLLTPQEYPSMQLQSLRKDMLRRFQQALERIELDDDMNYKRSLSSLAQWDNLPIKRNLEALARAGLVRTLPTDEDGDDEDKRSDADKQTQPGFQINDAKKRGIQSLARNGELHTKKQIEDMLEELYNKRNIGSLARNFNFPSYGKRYLGALVRNGDYQYGSGGKRNLASIAREGGRVVGKRDVPEMAEEDKAAKFKKLMRAKRQAYFGRDGGEYSSPVYQNQNVDDYEEMMKVLTGAYPNTDKRFLGSVARSGWFMPSSHYEGLEKRHIGALARLGWLPTLRNVRRFNRSGRSSSSTSGGVVVDSCREAASDGQAEDDAVAQDSPPLEDKRFLLQPAVDRILLRKIFMHPRTHAFISSSDMS